MNNENEMEKLRESLSAGELGSETDLFQEEDVSETVDETLADDFIKNFTTYKHSDYVAHIPGFILDSHEYSGYLYGLVRKETESFYIIDSGKEKYNIIGYILNDGEHIPDKINFEIIVTRYGDRIECKTVNSETVRIKRYDEQVKLFSRNSGLLESALMLKKCAVMIGSGSVGSFIAMELARSGVGKFVLCDTDILEIHNICRHQCGFDDLGRYKVDAVRDKILNINPKAEVIVFKKVIQRVPMDELLPYLGVDSIVIGTGDNRASSAWACDKLAIPTNTSFVTACCWTRAFAGEIMYWTPGKKLPCYQCALGELIDDERPDSHAEYFGSDNEAESLAFEPGVAVDIDFVSVIATKLILDLINKNNPDYTPRVINYLTEYTWICNTNERKIGGERAGIFTHPLQITHNLHFKKSEGCETCGDKS